MLEWVASTLHVVVVIAPLSLRDQTQRLGRLRAACRSLLSTGDRSARSQPVHAVHPDDICRTPDRAGFRGNCRQAAICHRLGAASTLQWSTVERGTTGELFDSHAADCQ